jgi:hypothetical protein
MADAITDAMIEAGAEQLQSLHTDEQARAAAKRVYLAMQAARQPQVPAEDVERVVNRLIFAARNRSLVDAAKEITAILTALQVTEGDKS